tara:strand:- start:956 stop:1066 length:111 start_codon:yes stop_codon:yes gene_type:complete
MGMNEIVWVMVTIGFISVSTDIVDWLADKIEERFFK